MIDIHSHVLWGLDDGARTLEDSLAMLDMAAAHGTSDIVATPHANPSFHFDPDSIRERLDQLREVSAGTVNLHSGCDFHLSFENIQDAIDNPHKYTINQKTYVLVEFSDLLIFKNTSEIFSHLQDAGMTPVITHPERNDLLRQRAGDIAEWVENGARIQVTAQSLAGGFGRRARNFCETLLDYNLVHFIASDAHDCQRRPPRLDEAYAWLEEHYGAARAEALCVTNPRAAIEGEPIELFDAEAPEPRKWYQLWRS